MSKNGGARKGAGRPKGSANRSTEQARSAIARFVDNNTERLAEWLDQIAEDSPKDAFDCVIKVMEYHLPKLQRYDGQMDVNNKHQVIIKNFGGKVEKD